ncbi:MAG: hypothetical protein KME52_15270 [Desmonostoc geniculatum HA4340-LM1]|jgi:hypothetical protein|nr:hypothetical protein [Desmonostoc geniculatum HA4340-LM1]
MFQQFLASALVVVAVTNTTSVDNLLTKEVLRDNQNVKVGVVQSVEESVRKPFLITQGCQIPVFYGMSDWNRPVYIAIANGQVYVWTGQRWSATSIYAYGSVFEEMMQRFKFVKCLR